jgi:hypothetical protein
MGGLVPFVDEREQFVLEAIDRGDAAISEEAAHEALRQIALKGSAPVQESTYKTAIGNSYTREFILKKFAENEDDEIHTTDLYSSVAKALRIEPNAVSVYVGHLSSDNYGRVLEKTRERYYRFRDSLSKAYAAARPWQLEPPTKKEHNEADRVMYENSIEAFQAASR